MPCAPRVGLTYASRLDSRTEKSSMPSIVLVGMPGPLSATVIPVLSTVILISGGTPASSQASRALSSNSFSATTGHSSFWWPVCAVSSFSVQKSMSREVSNVTRLN